MHLNRRSVPELDSFTDNAYFVNVVQEVSVKWTLSGRDDGDDDGDDDSRPKPTAAAAATTKLKACSDDGDDNDDDDDCTTKTKSSFTANTSTNSSSNSKTSTFKISTIPKMTSSSSMSTTSISAASNTATTTPESSAGGGLGPAPTRSTPSISKTSVSAADTSSPGVASASSGMSSTEEAIAIVLVIIGIIIVLPTGFFLVRRFLKKRKAAATSAPGARSPPPSALYRTSYSEGRLSEYVPSGPMVGAYSTANGPLAVSFQPSRLPERPQNPVGILAPQQAQNMVPAVANSDIGSTDPFADPNETFEAPVPAVEPGMKLSEVRRGAGVPLTEVGAQAQSEMGTYSGDGEEQQATRQTLEIRPGGRWSDPFTATMPMRESGELVKDGRKWRSPLSWVKDQRGRVNDSANIDTGVKEPRNEAGDSHFHTH